MGYKRGGGPGACWGFVIWGPFGSHLGSLLFGAHWAHLGPIFYLFGAHLGPILFGAHLGPILALAAIPFGGGGYWCMVSIGLKHQQNLDGRTKMEYGRRKG